MQLSDAIYDLVEEELRKRNPDHPQLSHIGAPPTARGKVKLPFFLPSLDKVKYDTLGKWIESHPGPYILMDKEDGVSLGIDTSDGEKLYTRGDGRNGQDISHFLPTLKKYKKIPKIPKNYQIRCEIITTEANFKKVFPNEKNPRNSVSGLVNRKEIPVAQLKAISIVAYEIIKPELQPSAQIKKLKQMGFEVVPALKVNSFTSTSLEKFLTSRKKKSKYAVDGIVIYQDKKVTRVTSGNPKHAVAFKSESSNPKATVKILKIVWQISKHGYLKPVAEIEPTMIGGTLVKRVTAINAKYVIDNSLGPGAIITVIRSGDVIPKIVEVHKPAPKPSLPSKYIWNETHVDILLPEGKGTSEIKLRKATHFFKTIGVMDFSEKLIDKLFNNGFPSVQDICKASAKDLVGIPGIQQKLAEKIVNGIKSSLSNIEMHTLMFASGEFGRLLGSKRLQSIVQAIPNVDKKQPNESMVNKIAALSGFTIKTANLFVEALPRYKDFMKDMPKIKIAKPKAVKYSSDKLEGEVILFTGFRDNALETAIEENSGKVSSGFSSNVTILLTKDPDSTSSKMEKAREKGIVILTPDKFKQIYNI